MLQFDDVRIVLADSRAFVRHSIKMALNDCGFRHVIDAADVAELTDVLNGNPPPDLLICDADLRGGDVNRFIATMRHHEVGLNPFLPVIAVTWTPTIDVVKAAVDAGTDFLLAAPVAPNQILARIWALIHRRKPFVITPDYVGPDRRTSPRAGETPLYQPPNALRAKALGEWDEDVAKQEVEAAIASIDVRKIESVVFDLAHMADELGGLAGSLKRYGIIARIDRMMSLATDIDTRTRERKYEHLHPIVDAIRDHIRKMRAEEAGPTTRTLEILKQLCLGLRTALRKEANTRTIAREIADILGAPRAV
jgi:DNA-binding response OmpR family regulator